MTIEQRLARLEKSFALAIGGRASALRCSNGAVWGAQATLSRVWPPPLRGGKTQRTVLRHLNADPKPPEWRLSLGLAGGQIVVTVQAKTLCMCISRAEKAVSRKRWNLQVWFIDKSMEMVRAGARPAQGGKET